MYMFSGVETCPWDLAAKYQIHVTADVSFALRQYLYVSTDIDAMHLLKQKGSALALDIARFWASRVSKSDNNGYDILGKLIRIFVLKSLILQLSSSNKTNQSNKLLCFGFVNLYVCYYW